MVQARSISWVLGTIFQMFASAKPVLRTMLKIHIGFYSTCEIYGEPVVLGATMSFNLENDASFYHLPCVLDTLSTLFRGIIK